MVEPLAEPDAGQRLGGPSLSFLPRDAGVHERQLHVLHRRRPTEQVEALEDEPERTVSHLRELAPVELRHLAIAEEVRARRRLVETAEDVHERRLARPRRPHDGDELRRLDGERHAVERAHLDVTERIDFSNVLEVDERHLGLAPGRAQNPLGSRVGAAAGAGLPRLAHEVSASVMKASSLMFPLTTSVSEPSVRPIWMSTGSDFRPVSRYTMR